MFIFPSEIVLSFQWWYRAVLLCKKEGIFVFILSQSVKNDQFPDFQSKTVRQFDLTVMSSQLFFIFISCCSLIKNIPIALEGCFDSGMHVWRIIESPVATICCS